MAQILTTDGLTRVFGSLVAVDRLTIGMEAGEVFGTNKLESESGRT